MKRLRFKLPVILLLLTCAPAFAQQTDVATLTPQKIEQMEQMIQSQMARLKLPGMTVAIALDGKVVYSKAFGVADLENSVAAKTTTLFRTASVAKPLTATAVMQLVEAGKIDLDAPIQKYCPAFPEKQWPVTVRHLLSHQGGVRHYEKPNESSGTEHFFTISDSLRLFKDDPLKHQPGTKFHYTTFGYSILGCAIEGASGQPYDEYLAEHVFRPAGMTRTQLDNHYLIIPDRTRGYLRVTDDLLKQLPAAAQRFARVGEIYNATLHNTSMKVPGGGLLSTSEDLVRIVLALVEGKLVKPETLEQMWTAQETSDGNVTSYGFGWNVPALAQGATRPSGSLVMHTGGQAGTSTVLSYRRDTKSAIAIMMNLSDVDASRWVAGIAQILFAPANAPAR